MSIKSQHEQDFLIKLVFDTFGIGDSVWIGAKRIENSKHFVWTDNSNVEFTYWSDGFPTEETGDDCVRMRSEWTKVSTDSSNDKPGTGRWANVNCNKTRSVVLCQKLQFWSFPQLQKSFLDVRKNLQRNPVPIGFIYAQLPGQPEPRDIWPLVE